MSDEGERGHKQKQNGRAVLGVAVDFTRHSDQSQQPGGFQQTNQSGRLKTKQKRCGGFSRGRYETGQIEAITGGLMCVRLLSALWLTQLRLGRKLRKFVFPKKQTGF